VDLWHHWLWVDLIPVLALFRRHIGATASRHDLNLTLISLLLLSTASQIEGSFNDGLQLKLNLLIKAKYGFNQLVLPGALIFEQDADGQVEQSKQGPPVQCQDSMHVKGIALASHNICLVLL
jgi:type II secretory pathway component PulC